MFHFAGIRTYVEKVGAQLYKPCRRFLREALFGLVDKRSVLLSQIGRALDEPCRPIHTEKRLSRNPANELYDDAAEKEDYLRLVAPILQDERYPRPVIAVDLTDIAKSRARKMPYLSRVWDGSKQEVADGYEVVSIVLTRNLVDGRVSELGDGHHVDGGAPRRVMGMRRAATRESDGPPHARHQEEET